MEENEVEYQEAGKKANEKSVEDHRKQVYQLRRHQSLPNKPFNLILCESTTLVNETSNADHFSSDNVNDQQPQTIQCDNLPITQQPRADIQLSKNLLLLNRPNTDVWMQKPQLTNSKVCLPGIECLSQLDQVLIHRRIDITERKC